MQRKTSVQPASPAVTAATQERLRQARAARYSLRCSLWKMSGLKSLKGCARNVNANAGSAQLLRRQPLLAGAAAAAGYAGLTLCSLIWACPVCSARIRTARALDIQTAGLRHLEMGGALYFLTLTMPHDAGDALADTLDVVMAGWRKVQQRKWFRALREAGVLTGFIRSAEITYTRAEDGGAGWHPHLHVLLFTHQLLTDDARDDLLGKIEAAWAKHVTDAGYRRPRGDGIGVNLRTLEGRYGADGLLAYIAKVQDNYGDKGNIGAEMVRGDLKRGKRANSRTPFELAELAAAGDGQALQLWHEYEKATAGRKALHWSDDLKQLLDAELAADEDVPEVETPAVVVAAFTHTEWRTLCRLEHRHLLSRLLDLAEREQYQLLDQVLDDVLERQPLHVTNVIPPRDDVLPAEHIGWQHVASCCVRPAPLRALDRYRFRPTG